VPKVKNVEKRIWDTEAFDVIIRHTDGRDMRSDKNDLPQYNKFECMAKNDVAVADSKARRFAGIYPGLAIDVLDGDGNAVAGDTKLGTVRDSYADE
jgi:hypothetical protein